MKLYFSPGACSLSPHIALEEAGLPYQAERVDLKGKKTASGGDYLAVNPKGQVPVLQLDDGSLLTEGPAIVQYIADQAPAKALAPAYGTLARYRLMEWLNFITSELHKGFTPLFNPAFPEDGKTIQRENLSRRFDWLDAELSQRTYLMGEQFTVADGYLFTVLGWGKYVGIDLARWPALVAYTQRVGARPGVHAALVAEGLAKA